MRADADIAGRNCPYCRFPIKEQTEVTVCPTCRSPHHAECWNDNRGCAITGCASGPASTGAPPPDRQAQLTPTPPVASTPSASQRPVADASSGRPPRERARSVVVAVSLIAILVLGGALAFAIGKNNGHGTTTTELVRTESSHAGATQTAATASAQEPSTGAPSPQPTPDVPSLQSHSGSGFSMMIPSGWVQDVDEKQIGPEVESRWANPSSSSEFVLLDVHTPTHTTMREGAEPVREDLAKQAGYAQIYYGPGDLSRHSGSWMWVFEVEGDERIDYFFETCSNTIGLLSSAAPARFDELRGTFREIANSFRSSCE